VGEAIDILLRHEPASMETRWLDENGEVKIEKQLPHPVKGTPAKLSAEHENRYRLFVFGVNRNRLEQAAKEMEIELNFVNDIKEANLFVTSKQYYRRKPQRIRDAEAASLPIYVLKNNTPGQVRQLIRSIHPGFEEDEEPVSPMGSYGNAIHEAEDAVHQIRDGAGSIELNPQSAYIRRLQHLIAERHDLASKSQGKDPNRRVVIYKEA
jgi:hypothetical protein